MSGWCPALRSSYYAPSLPLRSGYMQMHQSREICIITSHCSNKMEWFSPPQISWKDSSAGNRKHAEAITESHSYEWQRFV